MPTYRTAARAACWAARKTFWILPVSVLAAGCLVGPDYKPSQTRMPEGWIGPTTVPASQPASAPATADISTWWAGFHDPTLSSLIERARKSNLDMRTALSKVRQARAARGVAAAAIWPTADASGAYTRHYPAGSPPAPGSVYQAGLDASWEIDVFGGQRRSIEAAEADVLASIEDQRSVAVSLAAEVALQYATLRGYQERIAIARKNLTAMKHSAELTRQRYEGGFVSALDVANADAQVASTAATIPLLEAQVRQTIYALSVLLGQSPGALVGELSEAGPVPAAPPNVPLGLPSDLLRRRPDVRRAEAQIHSATAQIGVATADLYPRFSMNGSLSSQTTDFGNFMHWSSRVWSFGPSASWQIFNAGKVLSNIDVQKALQEQAALAYTAAVLTALQDVENALVAHAKEYEHNRALSDAVTANRRAVDLSTKLYTQGQTDFLNVLDAQRSLFASEDALSQSTTALTTNLIAVYKALGGGWDETAPPPVTGPVESPLRLNVPPLPAAGAAAAQPDFTPPAPESAPPPASQPAAATRPGA